MSAKETANSALEDAQRPGENPEDRAFKMIDDEMRRSIKEAEPGTEKAYSTHVAEMIERYAANIRESLEQKLD